MENVEREMEKDMEKEHIGIYKKCKKLICKNMFKRDGGKLEQRCLEKHQWSNLEIEKDILEKNLQQKMAKRIEKGM